MSLLWGGGATGASTTTSTTPAVSNLEQQPRFPGAPRLPASCNLSWPIKAWPPETDAQARAHALQASDVPAGMLVYPAQLASNGPDLDQLATGWPHAGFAEISAVPAGHPSAGSSIDEMVGRAGTSAQAAATYRRARDTIFGSCVRDWPGGEGKPRVRVTGAGADLFAFEESDQQDHGFSRVSVVMLGHRGRFDFELTVTNFTASLSSPQNAPTPTQAQLAAALRSAWARLRE